jgi:hypothetical protein
MKIVGGNIVLVLFSIVSASAVADEASSNAAAKEQIALSKKDPCYGWFYSTTVRFRQTQAEVVHASESQQPCAPAIEKFKAAFAPVPAACEKRKLKAAPKLLKTQLAAAASVWNKRGWQQWQVEQDGALADEFGKVRDFYLRDLQSGCDTRK